MKDVIIAGGRDAFERLAAGTTRVELGEDERRTIVLRAQEVR